MQLLFESSGALPSLYSPWSNLQARGILSGLTPADYICSLAQVVQVIAEFSHLLSRPSTSSPLDNQARLMASNNQALDLEGLHREMHGIAEHISIMNGNNAHMIQHLTTNNPPPSVAAHIPEEID
ncbi:hypothetical protein Acr_00g0029440 [Actinidia rufa]|uniref:Uncharacterized protein n=1 Tax=Actinidia rufa TaxID=165716 RepID=A0A7J0DEM2_9ERIC|nr:hypothetical protein Acr_00g0029440 [Actinidia rufa]